MKKRSIFASLVLALTCIHASSPAWAMEVKWPLPYGKTISDLCQMAVLPGDLYGKNSCTERSLKASGLSSRDARRLKTGHEVTLDLTEEQHRRLLSLLGGSSGTSVQSAPTQQPIMVDPPSSSMEDIQLKNDVRVLQTQVSDIKKATDTNTESLASANAGISQIAATVTELRNRPPGPVASLPQDFWNMMAAIGIGVLILIGLVAFLVFRSTRRLEKGHGRTMPMEKNPFVSTEGRKALATLSALIDQDESLKTTNATLSGEVTRLNKEVDGLRKDLERETKQAQEAAEKLSAASKALEEARASGKASAAEIRRLEGDVKSAQERAAKEEGERRSAEEKLASATAGVQAALHKEQRASQSQQEADASLKRVADELVLEGGERPKK